MECLRAVEKRETQIFLQPLYQTPNQFLILFLFYLALATFVLVLVRL